LEKDEVSGTANGQKFRQPLDKSEKNGLEKANFNSPPKSPLPRWEGIHPVKYELFDVIHLESMHQDVEHGCLSLSFNRVKGRGTEHFAHPSPNQRFSEPVAPFILPHREGEENHWVEKSIFTV